jgi:hypothetical protein
VEKEITAALIGAGVACFTLLIHNLTSAYQSRQDRRNQMYATAYREALSWCEMLYRVRRRLSDDEEKAIVLRFHELQESLDYYQGWIGTESKHLARSYSRFVAGVKTKTKPFLQEAWTAKPISPSIDTRTFDHPKTTEMSQAFLEDVRLHLSPWFWNKWRLIHRNKENAT